MSTSILFLSLYSLDLRVDPLSLDLVERFRGPQRIELLEPAGPVVAAVPPAVAGDSPVAERTEGVVLLAPSPGGMLPRRPEPSPGDPPG